MSCCCRLVLGSTQEILLDDAKNSLHVKLEPLGGPAISWQGLCSKGFPGEQPKHDEAAKPQPQRCWQAHISYDISFRIDVLSMGIWPLPGPYLGPSHEPSTRLLYRKYSQNLRS